MKDTSYARLFDVAFRHARGNGPDERKDAAQRSTNSAMAILRTGATTEQIDGFKNAVTPNVGVRGATALAKLVDELRTPNEKVVWRPAKRPMIAIITGSETEAEAQELHARLTARGAGCWFYRNIGIGRRIRHEDETKLMESDYIVFLTSRSALEANWVQWELDVIHWLEMKERRERLLPVIVDDLTYDELPPQLGPLSVANWPKLGIKGVLNQITARIEEDRARSKKGNS